MRSTENQPRSSQRERQGAEYQSETRTAQRSQIGERQQRHYYDEGRHYTYEPTENQLRAMRRNIEIARNVWMRMSPEERSAVMPGGPEGPEPSAELEEARRRNVEIAREAWMNMSPEERSKRMPGGGDYEPQGRSGSRRSGSEWESGYGYGPEERYGRSGSEWESGYGYGPEESRGRSRY